jgi:DNA polymerase III sliding clamp (beta) subunit (PCNA family)
MQFTIQRKQLRAILNFAAVKDIRYYLNGLHVRQDHRGTILEATDGHALGMLRVDDSPKPVAA